MTPGGYELESQKQNKSGGAATDAPLPDGCRMTELGPLPEDWRVVRLRDVAIVKSGGSAPQGEIYFLGGKHPFVRVQHLDVDTDHVKHWDLITDEAVQRYHLQKFPAGTIVFPKSGASIRLEKRAMLPVDSYIVSHLCAVLPKSGAIERLFLFYSLKAKRLSEDKADGYPVLNLSEIRGVPIPLPPLPEQRAIAHVLWTVQRAREATERVIAALRELKKSLMQHLFAYGPVPVNAADCVETHETEIGPLPAHWQVVRLGEAAHKPQYGYTASATQEPVGPKFLRITDIQNNRVHWATVPFCTIQDDLLDRYQLQAGDLLFARIGATTGKTYLVTEPPKSVFASYLICVRTHSESLLAEYLYFFTQTPLYWQQINAAKGGRLKQGINIPILTSLRTPLPPLDEQREIARILQTVDRKIEAEEARKEALDALFRSLLHHLMTAKIRLPKEFVKRFEACEASS